MVTKIRRTPEVQAVLGIAAQIGSIPIFLSSFLFLRASYRLYNSFPYSFPPLLITIIGNQFDLSLLARLCNLTTAQTLARLRIPIQENFVVVMDEVGDVVSDEGTAVTGDLILTNLNAHATQDLMQTHDLEQAQAHMQKVKWVVEWIYYGAFRAGSDTLATIRGRCVHKGACVE
jgi:hypothetical protein